MAPYVPEEVDVFTVPHSRMKELVHNYFAMVQSTNFTDCMDLQQLLECLSRTFIEFKVHEQIENRFIMKRLKLKLKRLSIRNTAVCNCHKDNAMTDMMKLFQDGYKKKTEQDRLNYGLQLKKALEDFTRNFLPHMKEEEEVFQPLLLQYFSYEELCELKQNVIQQHLEQEFEKTGLFKKAEKENSPSSSDSEYCTESEKHEKEKEWEQRSDFPKKLSKELEKKQINSTTIHELPPEIMTHIFQNLPMEDLCQCVKVSQQWNKLAMEPGLWKNILPSQWARGDWSFHDSTQEEEEEDIFPAEGEYITLDDDADIDESLDNGHSHLVQRARNEARILSGLSSVVLPQVGTSVRKLVLSNCRTLTNGMLQRFLSLCPNVEHLDLSQTRITDAGLRRLGKNGCGSKLKSINLSGCVNITDATMVRLAMALSNINSIHGNAGPDVEDKYEETADDKSVNCLKNCDKEDEFVTDEIIEPPAYDRECLCEKYYEICERELTDPCVRVCRPTPQPQVVCACTGDQQAACNVCDGDNWPELRETSNPIAGEAINGTKHFPDNNNVSVEPPLLAPNDTCCGGKKVDCCKKEVAVNVNQSKEMPKRIEKVTDKLFCKSKLEDKSRAEILHKSGRKKRGKVEKHDQTCDDRADACLDCDRLRRASGDLSDDQRYSYMPWDRNMKDQKYRDRRHTDTHVGTAGDCGHAYCTTHGKGAADVDSVEDCVPHRDVTTSDRATSKLLEYEVPGELPNVYRKCCKKKNQFRDRKRHLEQLNLSGCYKITDLGLRALAGCGTFPSLWYLDVSGLLHVTAAGIQDLVSVCSSLKADDLYYCDNILGGPFSDTASGCRNLQCGNRVCCRSGD